MEFIVKLVWKTLPLKGRIEIINGTLLSGRFWGNPGKFENDTFSCPKPLPGSIELVINADNIDMGANPTMAHIHTESNPFTFFIRDVQKGRPIFIPAYNVAVTTADDNRSFDAISNDIQSKGLQTGLEQIDSEPEESYEQAAANTRSLISPIWLGISRDVRIFEAGVRQPMGYVDWFQPRFAGHGYFWEEKEYTCPRYGFVAGRGWSCTENAKRSIEDDMLPIFHTQRTDGGIDYKQVSFVTLEKNSLTEKNIRGTHFLVSDGLSTCKSLTPEQDKEYIALKDTELNRDEETILCCQVKATNTDVISRYAFFKTVHPLDKKASPPPFGPFCNPFPHNFDAEKGFGMYKDSDLVFGVSLLNGKPMRQEEIAVLLNPGQSCVMEFFLPHEPIPQDRAAALSKRNVQECLQQCKAFWKNKIATAAQISLPEKRIEQMMYAGLLHLDLVNYGLEPDGTLNPSNGAYSGLGSETTRNILFYESMGWHDIARRCLDFFLEKQHENGLMQNFEGYMLETGVILWCLYEHYLYTHDDEWVKRITPNVIKACEFHLNWRKENKKEELRGKGYGLLNGKVADPQDHERTFMLNGYAYLGLNSAAKLLANSDKKYSENLAREAKEFRQDIRTAFFEELARGPVVPLGDGSWVPTVAPWVGQRGIKCLFTDGKDWWTHGTMAGRDDMLGPIHLAFQDVFNADEQAVTFILNYQDELMHHRNVGFSQPYYSPHPWIHLMRGEVKRFLKAYYNTFASLADRETYSFWEHFYHESAHKTAEEAMFLLQCRWMLYMERGQTLKLLPGVPRIWLEDGKKIELKNVASHFGNFSLSVMSNLKNGIIEAEITCDPKRKPESVEIRLPHPSGKKAKSVDGGEYDSELETVKIQNFKGQAKLKLIF
ncbi:MAG: glucosidase family protein [Sedimentisphaerales bacterium]